MRVFRSRLFSACVASIVTALVVGGIAYATIPGPNGVISGCYSNKTGALRVIDTSKTTCVAKTETQLEWNQKGATGANGSNGAPGASGVVSAQAFHGVFFGGVPVNGLQWFGPFGDPSVTVAAGQKIVVTMSLSGLRSVGAPANTSGATT